MDSGRTKTIERRAFTHELTHFDSDAEIVNERLAQLLAANAETAWRKKLYHSDREEIEVQMMSHPLSLEKAFSYFGLMLGFFPPAALFLNILSKSNTFQNDEFWLVGLFGIANLVTAIAGYFSGKLVGTAFRQLSRQPLWVVSLMFPLLGLFWGLLSGAAGGVFLFVIGAVFAGMLGAAVGAVALPLFAIAHHFVSRGQVIERKHFLPMAFGITFTICGFILSF